MTSYAAPLALLALCAVPLPAFAQDPFADVVQSEVLQGWDLPDGRRLAAVQLTLAEGWKTYWRSPGDAGIPPRFDWSGAQNLEGVAIIWPTPKVFDQSGLRSIGYAGRLVIPMYLTPARPDTPVRLRSTMSLGVCEDICVPYVLELDTVLDAPDPRPTPAIVAALADTPLEARDAGVRAAACRLRPTDQGMEIEARVTLPHTGGTEFAVIETGTAGLWISEAKTARRGDTVVAVSQMVDPAGGTFAIDLSAVRITILGGDYAVDVQGCADS